MEVNVESTGALTRSLHVTIPADEFEKELGARLKDISRRARVPGFRRGHVPMSVIQRQFGASARADAVNELLRRTYPDALEKAGVSPAGMPRIEIESRPPEKPLGYVAHFDVLPEVKLDKIESLEIERPKVQVTDADVDKLLLDLRKAKREWKPVERAAQDGDQVNLDFEGKLDDKAFAGGSAKKVDVELGAGQFVGDLERAIVGHKSGESFTAEVKFPADYRSEELRGKTTQFDVTVHEVKAAELPEVDEAFLKSHGVDAEAGLDGLKSKCRTALEAERDKAVQARVKDALMQQLLAAHPLELPPSRVEAEIERLREEAVERMGLKRFNRRLTPEKEAEMLPANLFESRARQNVALGLLLSEFVSSEKIEADEARVDAILDGVAASYENPEEVRQYYRSNKELLRNLHAVALEEKAVEALLTKATVSEREMPLSELLNPAAPATA